MVPVYYATDRKPVRPLAVWKENLREKGSDYVYYGSDYDPDKLELGVCPVSIPRKHQTGIVERPKWYEFNESLERHFTIVTLTPLSPEQFIGKIDTELSKANRQDAFVFIHGFNVTFSAAVMRTAQLTYDWGFEGVPILYSWASDGTLSGYDKDQDTINLTQTHLKHFLREVVAKTKATRVHLIAHSMGNRALTEVLKGFVSDTNQPLFQQVILAAPDVNRVGFLQDIAPLIPAVAKRITLYASSEDKALIASQAKSQYPRAGEGGPNLVVCAGIETVDASGIDTDFLGHSYMSEARAVITDLAAILCQGLTAEERKLSRLRKDDLDYWKIP